MEKSKSYQETYYTADIIKRSLDENIKERINRSTFRLRRDNESWEFDDEREFYAEYRKPHDSSTIRKYDTKVNITINYTKNSDTTVLVQAKSRGDIESVFEIFEENYLTSIIPNDTEVKKPVIFIGHGRSSIWRDLKDHLTDKHDYKIEAYETGIRYGNHIKDILEDMATKSSFAILVLTGEDEGKDGSLNARPNVIHETGLFQGKLGFSKAIVLLEEGTEEFSNLHGIQQIRFSKGNIKEVYGDILSVLRREFEIKKH